MEILISHSDYEDSIDLPSVPDIEFRIKSRNHRAFLKQPLSIEMFVPCKLVDGVWVVMEEPEYYLLWKKYGEFSQYGRAIVSESVEYSKAKERCLFDGFELSVEKEAIISDENTIRIHENNTFSLNGKQVFIIEDLVKYKPKLTATALKQIL